MNYHRNSVIRLADLTVTGPVVRSHQFENCLILGPAVVALTGESSLEGCQFNGEPDELLWEIPTSRPKVIGATLLEDCRFARCTFQQVGFAGPPEFIDKFLKGTAE